MGDDNPWLDTWRERAAAIALGVAIACAIFTVEALFYESHPLHWLWK
jgi:hypothetical protein